MYPCHRRRPADCILLMLGALLLPASVLAADAHQAVQSRPGDIVLLRNVSARPAYRQAPPGMALMVDPSPRHELARALGTGELSDADYASLGATPPVQGGHHGTAVEQVIGNALGNTLSGNGGHPGVSGDGISNVIAGPVSAVGSATHGIGDQVRGALSQLPGMTPAAPVGH